MANDADLLKEIRENFDYAMSCWRDQREQAKIDTRLVANEPFTEEEIHRRGRHRPLVLIDRIGQYTNQVINEIRQNPRGINLKPKDLASDQKDAQRRANLIREIEKESDAQAAYSTAYEGAVAYGGMGFIKLTKVYESVDSMNQKLLIERVGNHQSILPDPDCKKIDFSDQGFSFVLDMVRHDQFRRLYPNAKIQSFSTDMQSEHPSWIQEKHLQRAEYWRRETATDTLLALEGSTMRLSRLPEGNEFVPAERGGTIRARGFTDVPVLATRQIEVPSIWQYMTNGVEILKRTPWDGSWIPIFPVVGREMFVDRGTGPKRQYVSLIRFASWAVKGMAYVRSMQMELVQMTPKTPWLAIEGQLEGFTDEWAKINTDPMPYAYYRAKLDQYGELLLPPPQRLPYEPPIQALEILHQSFERDLMGALGMYRASVGDRDTGARSGKMVQELDKQSDQGSFHFTHNFNQALEHLGTCINELLDPTYDTMRDVGSAKPDGSHEVIRLNDPNRPESLVMGRGQFAVEVSVGPAMESEREEVREFTEAFLQVAPQLLPPDKLQRIVPLLIKLNLTGPVADQMVSILLGQSDATREQLIQDLQMAQQEIMAVKAELAQCIEELRLKKFETASKERIALINAEVKLLTEQLKNEKADADRTAAATENAADREATAQEGRENRRATAREGDASRKIDLLLAQLNALEAETQRQSDRVEAEAARRHEAMMAEQARAAGPEQRPRV